MGVKKEELEYVKASNSNSAVLGTLVGPCADIINCTRNGRKYSEKLWEKVFQDEIVKEYFEAGGIFGELGHPVGRDETDMEKIAICMKNPPVKGKNGLLEGRWDILDTPNGRILKTLVDYGYKMGISSRGTGDVYEDIDGQETVDEDTYNFQGFDAVLLPAVKAARLTAVHESLDGRKPLRQALTEALDKASPKDRKIMEETLVNLDIGYKLDESQAGNKSDNEEEKVINEEPEEVVDDKSDVVVQELQEALKEIDELKRQVQNLQEQLSVSNAKEIRTNEELARYKRATIQLSTTASEAKALQAKNASLESKLEECVKKEQEQSDRIQKLLESKKVTLTESKSLNESIKAKDTEINSLKDQIKSLNESISAIESDKESEISKLQESLTEMKQNSEIKNNEYKAKMSKAKNLVETYKKRAYAAVDRYISSKAVMLGVTKNEIVSRLSEDYSFEDIDAVCESLQEHFLNVKKLPFNLGEGKTVKIKATESKNDSLRIQPVLDDELDESLLRLAKIK